MGGLTAWDDNEPSCTRSHHCCPEPVVPTIALQSFQTARPDEDLLLPSPVRPFTPVARPVVPFLHETAHPSTLRRPCGHLPSHCSPHHPCSINGCLMTQLFGWDHTTSTGNRAYKVLGIERPGPLCWMTDIPSCRLISARGSGITDDSPRSSSRS